MRLFSKLREREKASKKALDEAIKGVQNAGNVFDDLREALRKIQVDVHEQAGHDDDKGEVVTTGRPTNGAAR